MGCVLCDFEVLFQPNQPKINQKNVEMGFESHMGYVSFDGVHLRIPHFVGVLLTLLPLWFAHHFCWVVVSCIFYLTTSLLRTFYLSMLVISLGGRLLQPSHFTISMLSTFCLSLRMPFPWVATFYNVNLILPSLPYFFNYKKLKHMIQSILINFIQWPSNKTTCRHDDRSTFANPACFGPYELRGKSYPKKLKRETEMGSPPQYSTPLCPYHRSMFWISLDFQQWNNCMKLGLHNLSHSIDSKNARFACFHYELEWNGSYTNGCNQKKETIEKEWWIQLMQGYCIYPLLHFSVCGSHFCV